MPPTAALAPLLLTTSQRRVGAPLSSGLLVGSGPRTNSLVAGGFSFPLLVVMILIRWNGIDVGQSKWARSHMSSLLPLLLSRLLRTQAWGNRHIQAHIRGDPWKIVLWIDIIPGSVFCLDLSSPSLRQCLRQVGLLLEHNRLVRLHTLVRDHSGSTKAQVQEGVVGSIHRLRVQRTASLGPVDEIIPLEELQSHPSVFQ